MFTRARLLGRLHHRLPAPPKRWSSNAANSNTPHPRPTTRTAVTAGAVGFGAGTLGACAGVGGSLFVIPGLVRFAGVPQTVAAGNSLIAVSCIALTSAASYAAADAVDIKMAGILSLAAAAASPVGAILSRRVDQAVLRRALAIVCISLAPSVPLRARLLEQRSTRESEPPRTGALACAGTTIGFISGMLGVGGGGFFTAALAALSDAPLRVVIGTSLASMVLPSAAAAVAYVRMGQVRAALVPPLVAGAVSGAAVGSRIALAAPEQVLQWGFAIMLVVLGVRMYRAPIKPRLPAVHAAPAKRGRG